MDRGRDRSMNRERERDFGERVIERGKEIESEIES